MTPIILITGATSGFGKAMAEKFAQLTSWNVPAPLYFPSRESILRNFSPNEFTHDVKPLWGATPFNNHLFTIRRRAPVTVSSAE